MVRISKRKQIKPKYEDVYPLESLDGGFYRTPRGKIIDKSNRKIRWKTPRRQKND